MTEVWVALFASSPPAAAVLISLNWFLKHLQGERTAQREERTAWREALSTTIATALDNNTAAMHAQTAVMVAQLERLRLLGDNLEAKVAELEK